jgi:enoyl-CoA hydratase/carnithine racemase
MGSAYLLPRIVGAGRATELLMLGDKLDAETALHYGLANSVHEPEELPAAAAALARRLADGPALAYGTTKSLIAKELDMDLASSIELEALTQALMMKTHDHGEFYDSWKEKREPKWEGR